MAGTDCICLRQVVRTERIGMIALAIALGAPFVWLASMTYGGFLYAASGQLFLSSFDRAHIGGALDQPSLTKAFFICITVTIPALSFVAACRAIANKTTRLGRRLFTIGASSVGIFVMGLLAIPFWRTVQYIHAMGVTGRRVDALVVAVVLELLVAAFWLWAVKMPRSEESESV